jgi:hypothetical protein
MAAGMDPRFMAATPSRPSGPKARGGLEHLRNTKEGKQLAARTEPRADGRLPRGSSSPPIPVLPAEDRDQHQS